MDREHIFGARVAVCLCCGKKFLYYHEGTPQKRCPICTDQKQARPSIVQKRELLNYYDGVEIVSLPSKWEHMPPKGVRDDSFFKMTIKGSQYGADWLGRIDIFASEPFKKEDVISIREMEVKHEIKIKKKTRQTMKYGTVEIEEEFPVTTAENDVESIIRSRRYLRFERSEEFQTSHMVYATAYTKITLKGLGRQFRAVVEDETCIASWIIYGGVRSGRAHTTGILAIVSPDHPLMITKTGDIQGEERYE